MRAVFNGRALWVGIVCKCDRSTGGDRKSIWIHLMACNLLLTFRLDA